MHGGIRTTGLGYFKGRFCFLQIINKILTKDDRGLAIELYFHAIGLYIYLYGVAKLRPPSTATHCISLKNFSSIIGCRIGVGGVKSKETRALWIGMTVLFDNI